MRPLPAAFVILFTLVAIVTISACGTRVPPVDPVQDAINEAFAGYGDPTVAEATSVAWCESRLDPTATNGHYLGLFQLGPYHYHRLEGGAWDDPYVNARAAASLYAEAGWQPWSCKP